MKIKIEIPEEFEEHFTQDKFKDSLERIMADIKHSLENGDCLCAGRYECETIEMLEKAFECSRQAYDVDKVVEELEEASFYDTYNSEDTKVIDRDKAIEIVKQGGVSDDFCEWKIDGDMAINPHNLSRYKIKQYDGLYVLDTCHHCRKKIKVVK